MSAHQDWIEVKKPKAKYVKKQYPSSSPPKTQRGRRSDPIPDFDSPEEKEKFEELKTEIPHLMMPGHIRRIARKINIKDLDVKVLSDEWIDYQRSGWEYVRVVKPDDVDSIPDNDDYDIFPLDNGWGDVVLFRRVQTN